jgi:DNA-binding GntR family transcriptional regulator
MHEESRGLRSAPGAKLERAIILQLLSGDGEQRLSDAQLVGELQVDAQAFGEALGRLVDAGLVCVGDSHAWASPAARHLDELGLIAI